MMNKRFSIPKIYKKMDERGFFNFKADSYLWLNEMEWFPIKKIINFNYETGVRKNIIPFAHTARYDQWVWVFDDNNNYQVGFCENVEDKGIYYAKNMEDAILRHIIEYVSGNDFYINEIDAHLFSKNESELKFLLNSWKKRFNGLLCDDYLNLIDYFTTLNLKKCKDEIDGEWYALISYDECDELINKYIKYDMFEKEFPIYM